jgi:hypothetical protein
VSKCVLSIALLTSMFAGLSSSAQEAESPTYLAWEDKYFATHDKQLSELVTRLLGLLPIAEWPTVTIGDEQQLVTITDRYFDIYTKARPTAEDPGFPETTAVLLAAIRGANGKTSNQDLTRGEQLRIPPLPVLAQRRDADADNVIRFFDHEGHTYAMADSFGHLPATGKYSLVDAKQLAAERSAYMTVLRIRTRTLFDTVFPSDFLRTYSRHLLVWQGNLQDTERYPLLIATLFADRSEPGMDQIPDHSSYIAAIPGRIAALTPAERDTARGRAEDSPLVLVDWNFDTGHGRLVRAVVDLVMDQFGLTFLATKKSVVEVDFDRTRKDARENMLDLLAKYRASKGDTMRGAFSSSEAWIRGGALAGGAGLLDPVLETHGKTSLVDPIVLAALFWEYFSQGADGAWMNFSFGLNGGSDMLSDAGLQEKPLTVCFVAAGNDPGPAAMMFPQTMGQIHRRNFLNVSFGSDVAVTGASSTNPDDDYDVFVPLLAPGAGFADHQGVIKPDNVGSSFAAPYVAVAAWAKHALDGTSPLAMRRSLMEATRPIRAHYPGIRSGGVFDPGLLLGRFGPRIVRGDGHITYVTSLWVVGEGPWGVRTLMKSGTADIEARATLLVEQCPQPGPPLCVWTRQYTSDEQAGYSELAFSRIVVQAHTVDGADLILDQSVPDGRVCEVWGTVP